MSLLRNRRALVSTAVGAAIAIAGLVFVVRALLANWDEVRDTLAEAQPAWIAGALALAALAMVAMAVPWSRAVGLLGGRLPVTQSVARYFVGEIGKYVPGGVWPMVGRGELARRTGIEGGPAYGSVVLSLGALYLACLVLAVALLPLAAGGTDSSELLWLLAVLPLGVLALHHAVLGRAVSLTERVTRRSFGLDVPRWGASIGLVVRYVPAWLLVGSATWLVSRGLGGDAGWAQVCFAGVLSWFVGFVVVPVPGGVGVREAAFVAAAPALGPGLGAAVALVIRVLFMLVDAAGAAAASAWLARRRRLNPSGPGPRSSSRAGGSGPASSPGDGPRGD